MKALSEWLQLMLGEITRKQDEAAGARAEEARRASEEDAPTQRDTPPPREPVGKLSTPTD